MARFTRVNLRPMSDLTSQERAALALWLVLQSPMTTRQLSDRVGLGMQGTRDLMARISRVVPIYYQDRQWWVNGTIQTE